MRFNKTVVKRFRSRKGCVLCHNMGSAVPTYCYVTVVVSPMGMPATFDKEVGICFNHSKPMTERNPKGIIVLDKERMKKTPFGYMAIRDEVYDLVGGKENTTILTGPSGKIPRWSYA